MSNNIFQKFVKNLLMLDNDIDDAERTVVAGPSRSAPDRSFNGRYFNNMIEVNIVMDGSGSVSNTDYGIEFINTLNTVGEVTSSLQGILVGYNPQTEVTIHGRGPLTNIYEALAFKMLVKLYAERIKHLLSEGDGIPDNIPVVQAEDNEVESDESQSGRTAKVMQKLNKDS